MRKDNEINSSVEGVLAKRLAFFYFAELLRGDRRVIATLEFLREEMSHEPEAYQKLAGIGSPPVLGIGLYSVFSALGLGGMNWNLKTIAQALIETMPTDGIGKTWHLAIPWKAHETRAAFLKRVHTNGAQLWGPRSHVERDVDWFFARHCLGKTPYEVADEAGYSPEYVTQGVERAQRLLDGGRRRGRPRNPQYSDLEFPYITEILELFSRS